MQIIKVDHMGKPRMTRKDQYRPVVLRYWAYKDHLNANRLQMPSAYYHMIFVLAMPKSWSNKKKTAMRGTPHQQVPDKDNLEKAVLDAIYKNDSHVWDGRVTKIWGDRGYLIVREIGLISDSISTMETLMQIGMPATDINRLLRG